MYVHVHIHKKTKHTHTHINKHTHTIQMCKGQRRRINQPSVYVLPAIAYVFTGGGVVVVKQVKRRRLATCILCHKSHGKGSCQCVCGGGRGVRACVCVCVCVRACGWVGGWVGVPDTTQSRWRRSSKYKTCFEYILACSISADGYRILLLSIYIHKRIHTYTHTHTHVCV